MSITKISPDVVDFDAGITISTTDNTSNLILTSTDADANTGPVLELYRNSSSPADNDEIGRIYFYGENDNDEKMEYGLIRGTIVDASDGTEDSALQIYTYSGGGQRNRIDLLAGETVFNEGSQDIDFRVESDGNANMLVVDAGTNAVGVGVSPSGATFHVVSSGSGVKARFSDNTSETLDIGITSDSHAYFNQANSGPIAFQIGGTEEIRVTSNRLTFNGDTASANALSDYEVGTWTPGIGEGAVTIDRAHYTKIGRLVHFAVLASGFTNRTSSNQVVFNNLPFPVLADHAAGTLLANYNDETNAQAVYVTTNEHIMFYAVHSVGYLTMAHNDLNNSSASIYFFGTYTAE